MDTAKIVPSEVQGDSGFQVRQFLAESVREPRESAKLHSHRQILSLHERRADVVRVGVSFADLGYNPRNAWWGIPRFGVFVLPIIAKEFSSCAKSASRPKRQRLPVCRKRIRQ